MAFGFFEDDFGNKSMSRLIVLGAFIFAEAIVLQLKSEDLRVSLTEWLVTAAVGLYSGNKLADYGKSKFGKEQGQ